jgi:electron transfer flavoprotein alpha subunit
MTELMVVAEHREGELREITFQMLNKASELCSKNGHELSVVVIGNNLENIVGQLQDRANRILVYDNERLKNFDPADHKEILVALIAERRPLITFMGHTPWSMDLAPALAVKMGYPLATDCVHVLLDSGKPKVVRQIYGGKIFGRMSFRDAAGYLVTIRSGSFPASKSVDYQAEVVRATMPTLKPNATREFIGYQDAGKGEVDISQAELLVSVGRGIGEEENIADAKELAGLMGGMLSCSRPIVDKKWLPKYHQVGTSGKTVKPKVYLALGISGAFQHVAGISGAETVIAVNKDKKAPIFRVAHYAVVADTLDIIAALKAELRKSG